MHKIRGSILHLSYDVGELNNTDKTTAVTNLIRETKKFAETQIVSFNRVNSYEQEQTRLIDKGLLRIDSFGLPYGIFHKSNLNRAFRKLVKSEEDGLLNLQDLRLVHSHKLTFEGFIGYHMSCEKNIPLFITLRQTDFDVLKYRPDLRETYKKILSHSSSIFYLVPIMLNLLKQRFGNQFFEKVLADKLYYLPNIVERKKEIHFVNVESDAPLITILRLTKRSVKRKNLKNLIKAVSELKDKKFKLNIIGGGDYLHEVKKWVNKYGVAGTVNFSGEVPNHEIDACYASAKGFVLPSYSESFGLVYAEALLNGTPILYSRGVIGFDGVFNGVGPAVEPNSVESIKNGIIDIIENNNFYRDRIRKMQESGSFKIFSPDHAASVYEDALLKIFNGREISDQVKVKS